jgi:hypothetical protein
MKKRISSLIALIWFMLVLFGAVFTAGQSIAKQVLIAEEAFSGTFVTLSPLETVRNVTLNISGPQQFLASKFSKDGIPSIELWNYGEVSDGLYKYELTGVSDEQVEITAIKMNNGRDTENRHLIFKSVSQSGSFRVKNGEIIEINATRISEGGDSDDQIQ